MSLRPLRVLSPTAILGYGFPEASFRNGLKKQPDLIGVDAGSKDPGPYYLGAGKSFTTRPAVKRALPLAETKNRAIDETARNQSQNKNCKKNKPKH